MIDTCLGSEIPPLPLPQSSQLALALREVWSRSAPRRFWGTLRSECLARRRRCFSTSPLWVSDLRQVRCGSWSGRFGCRFWTKSLTCRRCGSFAGASWRHIAHPYSR